MKTKDTIILLVLTVLLGAYILVKENPFTRQAAGTLESPVFSEDMFPLSGFVLRHGKTLTEFQSTENGWFISGANRVRADKGSVETLIQSMKVLKFFRSIPANRQADLSQYGLDAPSRAITLKKDGQSRTLLFGKETPGSAHIFAMIEGEPEIFVTSREFYNLIVKDADEYTSRSLCNFNPMDVRRIEMVCCTKEAKAVLEDKEWFTELPSRFPCDNKIVFSLLKQLADLQADGFARQAEKPLGRQYIRLYLTNDRKVELELSPVPEKDQMIVFSDYLGRAGRVKKEALEKIAETASDMRRKKVFVLPGNKLDRITITRRDGEQIVFENKKGIWGVQDLSDPDPVMLRYIIANIFYCTINDFVPLQTKDLSVFGLDKPRARVEILSAGRRTELIIGRMCKKGVFAKYSNYSQVFTVSDVFQDSMLRPRIFYKNRQLWDLDKDKITEFTRVLKGKTESYRKILGNNWQMTDPQTIPADNLGIQVVLIDIARMKAKEYVKGKKTDPAFGLTSPLIRLAFKCKGREYEIRISAQTKGKLHYACVNTDDSVFTVSEDLFKDLQRKLIKEKKNAF